MVLPYGKLSLAIVIAAASLVLIDGRANESEYIYIENLAVNLGEETGGAAAPIPHLDAEQLTAELRKISPEERELLYNDVVDTLSELGGEALIDSIAGPIAQMTKVDGSVSKEEKAYLLQVARDLGYPAGTEYFND